VSEVKREHRELALATEHSSVPHKLVTYLIDGDQNTCVGAHRFERIAQALADLEAATEARARLEQTEDAWAVGVLDAWALTRDSGGYPDQWGCMPWDNAGPQTWKCCLTGDGGQIFYGPTPVAARIAAARALRSEDELLGPPPPEAKE
jgi:hypothetical protein